MQDLSSAGPSPLSGSALPRFLRANGVVDVGEGQVAMWICVSGLALWNACMTAPSRWPRPNPKVLTPRGFPAGRGARRSATSSIAGSARAARTRKARPLSGRETRRVVRSAYASRGTQTGPGDLLDSGTCQDGCLAELWGRHDYHVRPPLQAGHVVTATVEGLVLRCCSS